MCDGMNLSTGSRYSSYCVVMEILKMRHFGFGASKKFEVFEKMRHSFWKTFGIFGKKNPFKGKKVVNNNKNKMEWILNEFISNDQLAFKSMQ